MSTTLTYTMPLSVTFCVTDFSDGVDEPAIERARNHVESTNPHQRVWGLVSEQLEILKLVQMEHRGLHITDIELDPDADDTPQLADVESYVHEAPGLRLRCPQCGNDRLSEFRLWIAMAYQPHATGDRVAYQPTNRGDENENLLPTTTVMCVHEGDDPCEYTGNLQEFEVR